MSWFRKKDKYWYFCYRENGEEIQCYIGDDKAVVRKFHFGEGVEVPRIRERWVLEAAVVKLLREKLNAIKVIPQGSPRWLGSYRFDAYIPELMLAVEYQGKQHYEAIEIFGGEGGFLLTQRRDRGKAELARENRVSTL
jgi:hypothetical protein